MTRLDKELRNRGIVCMANDYSVMMGPEYDTAESFIGIDGDFIVTVWTSAVLDPILKLYDRRTFQYLGNQNLYPDDMTFDGAVRFNKWESCIAFGDCDLF